MAQPAAATLSLALPLDCRVGESCWVANYVDVDPGPNAADFRCGPRSYQKHDGVDFALRDLGRMAQGVAVRAAAAGIVRNVRDGEADTGVSDAASYAKIAGRDCGNAVMIDHPGGWHTYYCHMRKGSVSVAPGQAVEAGARLGLVGLSGRTEFPHLHLGVRHGGKLIDPFTGQPASGGCGGAGSPLWANPLEYETVALYNAGFAPGEPDIAAIRRGERGDNGPISADAPVLVLWVDMFGVQAGDRVELRMTRPDGSTLLDSTQVIARTQAQRWMYIGDRRSASYWSPGTWTGEIIHHRTVDGQTNSTTVRVRQEVR